MTDPVPQVTSEPGPAVASFSDQAEELLVGCALNDPEAVDVASAVIGPADFYRVTNRDIWAAIVALRGRQIIPDFVAVPEALKQAERWGHETSDQLSRCFASVASVWPDRVRHYAAIVRECSVRRQLANLGSEVARKAPASEPAALMASTAKRLEEIAAVTGGSFDPGIGPACTAVMAQIEERYKLGGALVGIPTGFTALDAMLGGLQRQDLIILAARPSVGKTALALNIAETAALVSECPSLLVSLEMSRPQIVTRLCSALGKIPHQILRSGNLKDSQWASLAVSFSRVSQTGLVIDDRPAQTLPEIRVSAKRAVSQGCRLVIVDYLQLVKGEESENRNLEVAGITRGLKALAKELNVPVLALSQLSRAVEKRGDRHPVLSDLRDSGGIEQDADVVLFLHRETRPKPGEEHEAELIVAKQRNGPTGLLKLHWEGQFMKFEEPQGGDPFPDWQDR